MSNICEILSETKYAKLIEKDNKQIAVGEHFRAKPYENVKDSGRNRFRYTYGLA